MRLGVDTVLVGGPFEDFSVRVLRAGPRPAKAQLELARWAATQFRIGMELGEPAVARAARQLVQLLDGDAAGLAFGIESDLAARPPLDTAFGGVAARLEQELLAGRLVVERERADPLTDRGEISLPDLPPLPPAPRDSTTHTFEVRFVDEVGKAITGIDAEFTADGPQTRPSNAAGIALLEGVQSSSANVSILDREALSKLLDARWVSFRPGSPPKESNAREIVFHGAELGPFDLKAEQPNTVIIKPPLGKLFAELWDKTGRTRHIARDYTISGPQSFAGTTDEAGRLLHENVFPGNYEISLTIEAFRGDPDEVSDTAAAALVVLDADAGEPQQRLVGAVPRTVLARLHLFFNTNKSFLLPTALPAVQKLRSLYADNAPCQLLVVGHADTRGSTAYNDKLSLERAQATIAYLKDDADAWFAFYSDSEQQKCWGKVEDHLMLTSLPDFVKKPKGQDAVKWFQSTRHLKVDGVAGENTRKKLIAEYMSLDGATLKDKLGEVEPIAHGCGENFPLDDSGQQLDTAPPDEKRDPVDRRVELFFFDAEFGVSPAPPGENSAPNSPEYPQWLARVVETVELRADDPNGPQVTFVEVADAHFRTDSAVVLPEGENPDQSGGHQALSAVGLFATALRFNDEHPDRSVFIAGHTDTAAGDDHNQVLSELRAQVALALLTGDRAQFAKLCNGRHSVADIKQILSWVSRAFDPLSFDCDPGKINDSPDDKPVRKFQAAFNTNKAALGSTAADLKVDGSAGEQTWGAFFDCYEFALLQELGEDVPGLSGLRQKLKFTDPARQSLGFGELFPIEELGVDEFRSQTNRRVEILFFQAGEEPDLAHAENDPETSELYLPGHYERTGLEPMLSAKPWQASWDAVSASDGVQRTLTVATPGLPAGTPAVITLSVNDVPIRLFDLIGDGTTVSMPYSDWEVPDEIEDVTLDVGEQFLPVTYSFEIEAGGRLVAGQNAVVYADRLFIQLSYDPNDGDPDIVLASESYVVQTPWGQRRGQADGQGVVNERGLPPGGISLFVRGRQLINLGTVPYNWDAEP